MMVAPTDGDAAIWLVLVYQMPPKSAALAARIRRKLTAAGAVYLSRACAVAPSKRRPETAMRRARLAIADAGGSAVLLRARALVGKPELSAAFTDAAKGPAARRPPPRVRGGPSLMGRQTMTASGCSPVAPHCAGPE